MSPNNKPKSLKSPLQWEEPYPDLFPPPREVPTRGWRWWSIAGSLPDALDTIQIDLGGQRFGVALGTHENHENLAFAHRTTFPHSCAQRISDILAYIFDTPVAPSHPSHPDCQDQWLKGSRRIINLLDADYCHSESDAPKTLAEARVTHYADGLLREFPQPPQGCDASHRLTLTPPPSLESALFLYHLGIASLEPASQFLHFWRVLEALTSGKSQDRVDCLPRGMEGQIQPVSVTSVRALKRRSLDLISVHREICRPHYEELLTSHTNDAGIMKWLHKQRHRAAHGTAGDPLLLADNYANITMIAHMVRLCARAAIQAVWVGTPL